MQKNNSLQDFFEAMNEEVMNEEAMKVNKTSKRQTVLDEAMEEIITDMFPAFPKLDLFGTLNNKEDMLKLLTEVIKIDAKEVADRTPVDASIIRNIFKDVPGISELMDKLTDDEINLGPISLCKLMEKKKKKDVKKAAKKAKKAAKKADVIEDEIISTETVNLFMKAATKLFYDIEKAKKAKKVEKVEKEETLDQTTTKIESNEEPQHISCSPLTAVVISLIIGLGGNPAQYMKQLNEIMQDHTSLQVLTIEILKQVTRDNPVFLNTYAYLCSVNFKMENITVAIMKDQALQEKKEPSKKSDLMDWEPGKATAKIARIKKKFQSGKRTTTETIESLLRLTEDANNNPLILIEILIALSSKDLPKEIV